jgi:hypothetical protein
MRRIYTILSEFDTEPVELFGAWFALAFGAWLLLPGDTFETARVFRQMSDLAPEPLWGIAVFALGLLCAVAAVRGSRVWRLRASLLHVLLWTTISGLFLMSNPLSTGVPTYTTFALGAVWVSLRHMDALPLRARRIPDAGREGIRERT